MRLRKKIEHIVKSFKASSGFKNNMSSFPSTLAEFAQIAINRKPTIHDIIHYVGWMGYIQETKYYPSTCRAAANHSEFAYANSRATYGKQKWTRLHAVCAHACSSDGARKQEVWARTTDEERWGYGSGSNWKKQAKFAVGWEADRVKTLLRLATAWAKENGPVIVRAKNSYGASALIGAVHSGNLEHVKMLLDAGAYPEGMLPLLYDAPGGEDDEVIMQPPPRRGTQPAHRSANLLEPFLGGTSALHQAIEHNHPEIVTELVRRGHRIHVTNFRAGLTPIQYAVKRNAVPCMKALLAEGAHPTNCLELTDNEPMITLLCKNGADINAFNSLGHTPLMTVAAARSHGAYGQHLEHAIKPLVKNGADIDLRNPLGQTALYLATLRENVEVIKILLELGANTRLMCNQGFLPIDVTDDMEIKCLIGRAALKRRLRKRI